MAFSRRHLLFVCHRTSQKLLGENWWGSRQLRNKDVDLIQCINLKSVSIFSYH